MLIFTLFLISVQKTWALRIVSPSLKQDLAYEYEEKEADRSLASDEENEQEDENDKKKIKQKEKKLDHSEAGQFWKY